MRNGDISYLDLLGVSVDLINEKEERYERSGRKLPVFMVRVRGILLSKSSSLPTFTPSGNGGDLLFT